MTRDRFDFTCSLVLIIYAVGKRIQNPVTECVARTITSDVKLKRKKRVVPSKLGRWVYHKFLYLEPWVL